MFYWSIHKLFVLNRCWKSDSLQIMIFVYICSTWSVVEIKTRFETWITRNDVNVVSLFHFSYLKTFMAYLFSEWTTNIQIKYFMYDCSNYTAFVLNRGWKRDSPNNNIRICLIKQKYRRTWNMFWDVKTRNDLDGVSSFHLSYLIAILAYLCSQWTQMSKTSILWLTGVK
jgi:hypothetical protein